MCICLSPKGKRRQAKGNGYHLCVLDLRDIGKPAGPPGRRGNHDRVLDDPAPLRFLLRRKAKQSNAKQRVSHTDKRSRVIAGGGRQTIEGRQQRTWHRTMGEGVLGASLMTAERWRRLRASIFRLFSCRFRSRAASYGDIPCVSATAASISPATPHSTASTEWVGGQVCRTREAREVD
jgi:hypothetical protein